MAHKKFSLSEEGTHEQIEGENYALAPDSEV
jgi:hypothetical protein